MGLTWAVGWACVGFAIEAIWEIWPGFPLGPLVDIWPFALAIPAFVGGSVFSVVLGIAARERRFDELSLPGFGALGAIGGALLGGLALAFFGASSAVAAAAVVGTTTLLSAMSASGTLALARLSQRQAPQLEG
jgi:hypothetical protein